MTIREIIRDVVQNAVRVCGDETTRFSVEVPPPPKKLVAGVPENREHGDYATNAALVLAKILKRPPMDLAKELADKCTDARWEVSVANPGFLNFKITDSFLLKEGARVLENLEEWGTNNLGEGKTVVVEYFQLNIAKRPHIGHLRSPVIGDSLKRLLLASGYTTVSDTHVGDWGTQFGILLLAYKELQDEKAHEKIESNPFEFLETLYQKENIKIEQDTSRRVQAKEEFAKLERGDAKNRKIWQWMVDISMKKLHESADRLGLLPFDEHRGESSYEEVMPRLVELALEKGVAKKTADGAVIVDLTQEKLDEAEYKLERLNRLCAN